MVRIVYEVEVGDCVQRSIYEGELVEERDGSVFVENAVCLERHMLYPSGRTMGVAKLPETKPIKQFRLDRIVELK
jgi:hypothetical protein